VQHDSVNFSNDPKRCIVSVLDFFGAHCICQVAFDDHSAVIVVGLNDAIWITISVIESICHPQTQTEHIVFGQKVIQYGPERTRLLDMVSQVHRNSTITIIDIDHEA